MAMHSGKNRRFSFCLLFVVVVFFLFVFRMVRLLAECEYRVCTLFSTSWNSIYNVNLLYFGIVCCFNIETKRMPRIEAMLFSHCKWSAWTFFYLFALLHCWPLLAYWRMENNGGFANWLGNEEMTVRTPDPFDRFGS